MICHPALPSAIQSHIFSVQRVVSVPRAVATGSGATCAMTDKNSYQLDRTLSRSGVSSARTPLVRAHSESACADTKMERAKTRVEPGHSDPSDVASHTRWLNT